MARRIVWDDGTVTSAETADELVAKAEAHIRARHPRLVGKLSREQILELGSEEAGDAPSSMGRGPRS